MAKKKRKPVKRRRRKGRNSLLLWKGVSVAAGLVLVTLLLLWYFGQVPAVRSYLWPPATETAREGDAEPGDRDEGGREPQEVRVYFGNSSEDPAVLDCTRVFPVRRRLSQDPAIARAALEELLAGPTPEEEERGYYSSINRNSRVIDLGIDNGTAVINFDRSVEEGVAGSCQVQAIKAQITQTLLQFDSVEEVRILVEGRSSTALQP